MLQIPRRDAIAWAELEARALWIRASEATACADVWLEAAQAAHELARQLRLGNDKIAADLGYKVAAAWGRAARCEGHAVPDTFAALPSRLEGYIAVGQGDAPEPEADAVVIRRIDSRTAQLLSALKAEEKRRKVTLILTGAGVLFAAVKFGLIDIPQFLKRRRA